MAKSAESPAPAGHNQPPKAGGIEATKLRSYVERIERLEEEKAGLGDDIKDVKTEAKSNGFDVKTINQVLKLRKMKSSDRTEAEYMLDLYKRALGMESSIDEGGESDF